MIYYLYFIYFIFIILNFGVNELKININTDIHERNVIKIK